MTSQKSLAHPIDLFGVRGLRRLCRQQLGQLIGAQHDEVVLGVEEAANLLVDGRGA